MKEKPEPRKTEVREENTRRPKPKDKKAKKLALVRDKYKDEEFLIKLKKTTDKEDKKKIIEEYLDKAFESVDIDFSEEDRKESAKRLELAENTTWEEINELSTVKNVERKLLNTWDCLGMLLGHKFVKLGRNNLE